MIDLSFVVVSDAELEKFQSFNTTKSETTNDLDLSEHGNDDRRRSSRATTQKNYAKQENDDESDEEEDLYEDGRPPPRRMRYKKRRGSDDSFIEDDDYEKIARKRKIVQYGKSISRSSITDHLKNFVNEDEQPTEDKGLSSTNVLMREKCEDIVLVEEDEMHVDTNDSTKEPTKKPTMEYNEQPSDDDDFPDEQEIFQANGLLKFQKTINAPVSSIIIQLIDLSMLIVSETTKYSSSISCSYAFLSTCHHRSNSSFYHDSSTCSTEWLSHEWTRSRYNSSTE